MEINIEKLKYPIGSYQIPNVIEEVHLQKWIQIITDFPKKVHNQVASLTSNELDYKYRPKGWTIQQVVNHCIDSHMNSVIRFKLALTEHNPVIRPYQEAKWAELPDTTIYDIKESVLLLSSIHKRWVLLLNSLTMLDFDKTFVHPEGNECITLKENLCIYAWHCQHHLQHIINAKSYKY